MLLSGADILVKTLIEQGCDTVFGYPGGQILNVYDSLYTHQNEIHHILTAHEQGAAHAADGYARTTGKVGVVLSTSGPGATNLVTGIATAYLDSIPMVAICGNVPTTQIGTDSFQEIDITGVTLPSTLKKIGDRAFMFTNVGDIDPPAGLEIIEEGAFAQMPNLTAINIPGGVKELPYMVFYNDVNLASVTLNEGLEKIGSDVFSSCSGLKSLILPDTVKELGENTFQNCTSLASINFPAGLTYIPYACFDNAGLTTLTIPENIVSIGGGAFGRCAKLTSVTLPASLTALGEQFGAGVFNGCSALTEVNFAENGKLTMIGAFTFNGCTSLTQITIPETVTSIEYCAFSESGLTSVDIPASVEKIAGQAFYLCNSLKTITLHEGLISVDSMAFTGCTSVKEIFLPRSLTTIGNNAFGYANWSSKVENFTIHGYAGTAAETYATENGFTFEAIAE